MLTVGVGLAVEVEVGLAVLVPVDGWLMWMLVPPVAGVGGAPARGARGARGVAGCVVGSAVGEGAISWADEEEEGKATAWGSLRGGRAPQLRHRDSHETTDDHSHTTQQHTAAQQRGGGQGGMLSTAVDRLRMSEVEVA